MQSGIENLVAASRKRRLCSRFLGRRLVQSKNGYEEQLH